MRSPYSSNTWHWVKAQTLTDHYEDMFSKTIQNVRIKCGSDIGEDSKSKMWYFMFNHELSFGTF